MTVSKKLKLGNALGEKYVRQRRPACPHSKYGTNANVPRSQKSVHDLFAATIGKGCLLVGGMPVR